VASTSGGRHDQGVTTPVLVVETLSLDSPEGRLADWAALYAGLLREQVPEMGPPGRLEPLSRLISDVDERVEARIAYADGTPVGAVVASLWQSEDRDQVYLELVVDPPHRRRGIGRALVEAACEIARADGRTALVADVQAGGPAAAMAEALGGRTTLGDVRSRLATAALDRWELEELAAAAAGYRIVPWGNRCPDELVDAAAAGQEAMNDRPQGDSTHEDQVWDAARIRRREAKHAAAGFEQLVAAAVHEETGAVAGLTEIVVPADPVAVWQENTAVVKAHRGHGLGIAIKATNLLRLLDGWPQTEWVVTWNAAENTFMRGVNTRLGFVPADEWQECEVPVEPKFRSRGGGAASGRAASPWPP
jgi:GNAT superfamily N-acetyltransferase